MSFGNFIRKARRVLGLRQLYIADLIGVSLSTYSQVEAGVQPPFAPWLIDYEHLASILHVSEDELRAVAAGERELKPQLITHYRIVDWGGIHRLSENQRVRYTNKDNLSCLAAFIMEHEWAHMGHPEETSVEFFTSADEDSLASTWLVSVHMDPVFLASEVKA